MTPPRGGGRVSGGGGGGRPTWPPPPPSAGPRPSSSRAWGWGCVAAPKTAGKREKGRGEEDAGTMEDEEDAPMARRPSGKGGAGGGKALGWVGGWVARRRGGSKEQQQSKKRTAHAIPGRYEGDIQTQTTAGLPRALCAARCVGGWAGRRGEGRMVSCRAPPPPRHMRARPIPAIGGCGAGGRWGQAHPAKSPVVVVMMPVFRTPPHCASPQQASSTNGPPPTRRLQKKNGSPTPHPQTLHPCRGGCV